MQKTIDFNILTRRQIAEALGKTERTITNWVKDGCPRQNGKYSLPAVIEWLIAREVDIAGTGVDSPALERYREARAKLVELELKERQGLLLDAKEVGDAEFNLARQIRDAFQNLPNRLCDQFSAMSDRNEIQQVMADEIYQILMALSEIEKKGENRELF